MSEEDETAHEPGACGGDCPRCQQERAERREAIFDEDEDYDEILWGGE
jgi:hypothetical protein